MNTIAKREAFQLSRRRYYPSVFLGAAIVVAGLLASLVHWGAMQAEDGIKLLVPAIAAIAGLVYFLYSQHLQETRLFVDLFRQFNERYDTLNDRLNEIFNQPQQDILPAGQKQVLFDYFNLCSEEWLYFKNGYIDPAVWASWRQGMKYFLDSADIRRLWTDELESGSYYGLTIKEIEGQSSSTSATGNATKSLEPVPKQPSPEAIDIAAKMLANREMRKQQELKAETFSATLTRS